MNERTAYYLIAQFTDYIRISDYGDEPSRNKSIIAHICDIKIVNVMRDEEDKKIRSFDITTDNESYEEFIDYLFANYNKL